MLNGIQLIEARWWVSVSAYRWSELKQSASVRHSQSVTQSIFVTITARFVNIKCLEQLVGFGEVSLCLKMEGQEPKRYILYRVLKLSTSFLNCFIIPSERMRMTDMFTMLPNRKNGLLIDMMSVLGQ